MNKNCETCGCKIPKARLKVLPNTTTCVNCSVDESYVGIITTDDRCDGMDVQIVKANTYVNEESPRRK